MNIRVCDVCGNLINTEYHLVQVKKATGERYIEFSRDNLVAEICEDCYKKVMNVLRVPLEEKPNKPSVDDILKEMDETGCKVHRKGDTDVYQQE